MSNYYKVKSGPIPETVRRGRSKGKWVDVLPKMKVGQWMEVPQKAHKKASAAANSYLKSRYSLLRLKSRRSYVLVVTKPAKSA
tara:strand:+ start:4067 stop:4315 length:249 start_codon:yes stop_codon:yes gene_type:complete